jgi:hypothetical protein
MNERFLRAAAEAATPKPASQETQALLMALGNIAQVLAGITTQLDLLIQMECGYLPRKDMLRRIQEFAASQAAATNGGQTHATDVG